MFARLDSKMELQSPKKRSMCVQFTLKACPHSLKLEHLPVKQRKMDSYHLVASKTRKLFL
jgi:hypothetical protein